MAVMASLRAIVNISHALMMSEQEDLLVLRASRWKYSATVETRFFEAYVETAPERQVPEILGECIQMQKEKRGSARSR